LAGVVLALGSALTWGGGDFGGGVLSRRAPVLGVVLGTLLIGAVFALAVTVVRQEPFPAPSDLLLSAAAGCSAVVGVVALYSGLAVGRMSVVAPITGVLAASLPVFVGSIVDGVAGPLVLAGFVLALAAIALVSRATNEEQGPDAGIRYAIAAGIGLGLFGVLMSGVSDGLVAGPLIVVRLVQTAILAVVIVVARRPWRVDRPLWPAMVLVGLLDVAGNLLYLASIQAFRLDVASAIASLYPVTTVALAVVLLHERVTGARATGIVLAAVAIVVIAAGSA
jgi:drug/metabolite transporter (DMT)-like permease